MLRFCHALALGICYESASATLMSGQQVDIYNLFKVIAYEKSSYECFINRFYDLSLRC